MRKFFAFALVLCFIPLVCGCVPLIIGATAGGLGAYAVGRDMVQGDSDKGFDLLWESAINVAKQRGIIQQENMQTGYMELSADSSKIWIRLIRLTQATTRIRISARKYSFPNMELAQDFFVKIVTGVK
jgi:head-tail adaptor